MTWFRGTTKPSASKDDGDTLASSSSSTPRTNDKDTPTAVDAQVLQRQFPAASLDECRRFRKAFASGPAEKHLRAYLEWKQAHGLVVSEEQVGSADEEEEEDDAADWERAIRAAPPFHHRQDREEDSEQDVMEPLPPLQANQLQQIVLAPTVGISTSTSNASKKKVPMTDAQGHRILFILPARMDMNAVAPQVYTTTFALYLYDKLQKTAATNNSSSTTTAIIHKRVVVALDVRPAPGWPNPPAYHLVGFIRHTVRALHRLFPDLLERCILFPIPPWAVTLYKYCIRPVLDRDIRQAVHMVAGECGRHAPMPPGLVRHVVTEEQAERLEKLRRRAFGAA